MKDTGFPVFGLRCARFKVIVVMKKMKGMCSVNAVSTGKYLPTFGRSSSWTA